MKVKKEESSWQKKRERMNSGAEKQQLYKDRNEDLARYSFSRVQPFSSNDFVGNVWPGLQHLSLLCLI